ncbi:hypothetical protein M430DRAFT_98073, partial [Amorphotheca resinae ATCC 22711]
DKVIRYLYLTKHLAIKYKNRIDLEQAFTYISNAIFANNLLNRRSTEGYVFYLFRGLVN